MIQLQASAVATPPRPIRADRRRRPSPRFRERARLRAHFREVLAELRARDVSELGASQRAIRGALIGELAAYAAAGWFPQNRDFPGRAVPHFVDAAGTPCAMAHLIASSGHGELVARISGTANYAFIRELADDPALQAWLAWAGLSVAEAARIQPSYCFVTRADECLCSSVNGEGVLEATVVSRAESDVTVKVDAVHGDVGTVVVGDELVVNGNAEVGDTALVTVGLGGAMPYYGDLLRVDADGVVEQDCMQDVPPLQRDDAIAALLTGTSDGCAASLKEVDPAWGESICDDGPGGARGCNSTAQDTGGAPLGSLLLVAAWWARRRRRAPRR
jgi:uncharacterized protein (TIGR03382 family)